MRLGLGLGLGVSPRAQAFVPTDVTGAIVWLRADTGYSAGTWTNRTGNTTYNFAQATSGKRPTVATAINSLPTLHFDAASQQTLATGTNLVGPASGEIFLVGKLASDPSASAAKAGMWLFGTAPTVSYVPFTDGTIYDGFGTTSRQTTANPVASMAQPFVYNVRSAASAWSNHVNGTQVFSTATNTVGWSNQWSIGSFGDANAWLDGDVAEVILFDHVLSAGDRALVNAYLAARYGITIA